MIYGFGMTCKSPGNIGFSFDDFCINITIIVAISKDIFEILYKYLILIGLLFIEIAFNFRKSMATAKK